MEKEIDLTKLAELIDAALVSKDPSVQKALRKFLFIAALATEKNEEDGAESKGPLSSLVDRLESLEYEISRLKMLIENPYTTKSVSDDYTWKQWVQGGLASGSGGTFTGPGNTTTITTTDLITYPGSSYTYTTNNSGGAQLDLNYYTADGRKYTSKDIAKLCNEFCDENFGDK